MRCGCSFTRRRQKFNNLIRTATNTDRINRPVRLMAVRTQPAISYTSSLPFRSRSITHSPRSPRPAASIASCIPGPSPEGPDASEAASGKAAPEAPNPAVPPPRPVWCLSAPSAEDSLRRIADELRAYGATNATSSVNAILRRDPLARAARNADLRALVSTLLDLRASAASGADTTRAAFPGGAREWARAPLELSLFNGEVRRIHRDLLKSPVELRHIVAARDAAAAATEGAVATSAPAAGANGGGGRSTPQWAQTASKLLLLPQLRGVLRTLRSTLQPQMLFADFSLWNLRTIQRFADELPHDAELQAALLRRLNGAGRYAEVVQRVSSGAYASSPACEVEYLRAMVSTGGLEHFRGDGPPPPGVPHGNLARFLEEVRLRLMGDKTASPATSAVVAADTGGSMLGEPPPLPCAPPAHMHTQHTVGHPRLKHICAVAHPPLTTCPPAPVVHLGVPPHGAVSAHEGWCCAVRSLAHSPAQAACAECAGLGTGCVMLPRGADARAPPCHARASADGQALAAHVLFRWLAGTATGVMCEGHQPGATCTSGRHRGTQQRFSSANRLAGLSLTCSVKHPAASCKHRRIDRRGCR